MKEQLALWMAVSGSWPDTAGTDKAGSVIITFNLLAAQLWCFGMAGGFSSTVFLSLIRLSDNSFFIIWRMN